MQLLRYNFNMKQRGRPKNPPLPSMSKQEKLIFIKNLRCVLGLSDLDSLAGRIWESPNLPITDFDLEKEPNRIVSNFSSRLQEAIRIGLMFAPNQCSQCGIFSILHAHHENYMDSPLKVVWLCPECHYQIHGEYRAARSPKEIEKKLFTANPGGIWKNPECFQAYYPILGIRKVRNTPLGSDSP